MNFRPRINFRRFVAALFLTPALLSQVSSAQSSPEMNLDSDVLSEIVSIAPDGDQSLTWNALLSSSGYSGATASLGSLGKLGDNLVAADWDGDGVFEIGIVTLNTRSGDVGWRILNGTNPTSVIFGQRRSKLISGGDYNGDGAADGAYASQSGRVTVRPNFLTGETDTTVRFSKRDVRGIGVFASPDGVADWIGFVRSLRSTRNTRRYRVTLKSLAGESYSRRVVGPRRNTGRLQDVLPVRGLNGIDHLAYVSTRRGRTFISLRELSGALLYQGNVVGTGLVIVGDYLANSGEEIGVETSQGIVVTNPFDGSTATLADPGGILVDHINVHAFARFRSPGAGGGGGGGGNTGGGLGKICANTQGSVGGFLWKPDSDVGDARGGKPVVLFTGGSKPGGGSIDIYARNGTKVCNFTYKASDEPGINNGADHYYSGWYGGCGLTGGQIAAKAREASGDGRVYIDWKNNTCLGPLDPTARTGGV